MDSRNLFVECRAKRRRYTSAFGKPATMPRMWAARQPTCLFHSQCFVEKMHSRTHTSEQEHCEHFLKICIPNRRQIRPGGTHMSNKSGFGGVLGLCGEGLGARRDQSPNPMHCRMRKSRSRLTLGGWLLVQFALFFALCFIVFSTLHPERHFTST